MHVTSLQTTLIVPPEPPTGGFISLWPGLDNVEAIPSGDNILHQPLLQWGGVCTDPSLAPFASWLAEAFYYSAMQYANGEHGGCNGGSVIDVNSGDTLSESIALAGGTWNQTLRDQTTGQSSTYSYSASSIGNQFPDRVSFAIEIWNSDGFNNQIPAVSFTDSSVTATTPFSSCALTAYVSPTSDTTTGVNSASNPVVSNGGMTCSYATITIYPVSRYVEPDVNGLEPASALTPARLPSKP